MQPKLRWKTLSLFVLICLALLTLLPSLGVPLPGFLGQAFNDTKIQLGLDLQGGLHIVYGVNLDKVVDDKADEIRRDVQDRLVEEKVEAKVETLRSPLGSVVITPKNAADMTKIKEHFLTDYKDVLEDMTCPSSRPGATCFKVSRDYAESIQDSALEQAIKTVKGRVDAYGIAEAGVVRKGDDIIVELPGIDEAGIERLKQLIGRTAQLEFKIVANNDPWTLKLYRKAHGDPEATKVGIETPAAEQWTNETTGQFTDVYLTAKDQTLFLSEADAIKEKCALNPNKQSDGTYKCKRKGRTIIEDYVRGLGPEFKIPDDLQLGFEQVRPRRGDVSDEITWRTYTLHRSAELNGTAVAQSQVQWDQTTGRPEVVVTFNRTGGRRFGDLTTKNIGRKMAIILDDEVNSAPTINTAITGGTCSISMGNSDPQATQKEAEDLVNVLRTGALPAPLTQQSESQVGASLGADSIQRTQTSMIVGAIIVILMMLYFYRVSGLIANLAMVLNVMFQLAILAMFQATLTLPGIAGVVLTIGMAVDANIIIYERIREEISSGKTVRGAVEAGFGRAFWTVFDAHVTNFVAGFVLLEYGTGPIRGFAVMLLIGVVVNLFTSTWVSRLFFDHWLRARKASAPLSI
jgi:preprotein translocase subunit SecD